MNIEAWVVGEVTNGREATISLALLDLSGMNLAHTLKEKSNG